MRLSLKIATVMIITCALASCAAGSPDSHHAAQAGILSEILLGFWHGLIAPITLIGELVRVLAPGLLHSPWRVYETHNPTVAYDLGFYLGVAGGPTMIWSRLRA